MPLSQSLDLDADGIDDVYELRHGAFLNPLNSADASQYVNGNPKSNFQMYQQDRVISQSQNVTNWSSRFSASDSSLVIRDDGSLWTWGANVSDGTRDFKTFPVQLGPDTNWIAVTTSQVDGYSFALKADGTLWVGHFTLTNFLRAGSDTDWMRIGSGIVNQGGAVTLEKTDGSWWMLSDETYALGTGWNAVCSGDHYTDEQHDPHLTAIKTDGTLWSLSVPNSLYWAIDSTRLSSKTNWVYANGGYKHNVALDANHNLFAWGINDLGEFGIGTTNDANAYFEFTNAVRVPGQWLQVDVNCEGLSTAAISVDGSLWTWGVPRYSGGPLVTSPVQVGTDHDWAGVKISSENGSASSSGVTFYLVAVKTDGSLWAISGDMIGSTGYSTGGNYYGQYVNPTNSVQNLVPIGTDHWISMTTDGFQETAGVKADGTLWHWGYDRWNRTNYSDGSYSLDLLPVRYGSESNWSAVWCASDWTAALKTDGTLWAWERFLGVVNGGSATNIVNRISIPTNAWPIGVTSTTASGRAHTLQIQSNGTILAGGANNCNQVSNASTNYVSSVTISGHWQYVYAAQDYSLGMMTNGQVYFWGSLPQFLGASAPTNFAPSSGPMEIKSSFLAVLTNALPNTNNPTRGYIASDGELWMQGQNNYGQIGDGSLTAKNSPVPIVANPPSNPFSIVPASAVLNSNLRLMLDVNHDGVTSDSETTTESIPYAFWINDNYDRSEIDDADNAYYNDDVRSGDCPFTPGVNTPDYDYKDSSGNRVFPSERDLEDFSRLWISGITPELAKQISSGTKIVLSWGDVGNPNPNDPTIDVFVAMDPDGGAGYLFDKNLCEVQQDNPVYVGRLGPGQSIDITSINPSSLWIAGHFIWCGVSKGKAALTLTAIDGAGNFIAQDKQYLEIKNIKDMYERWTIGDDPLVNPRATAQLAQNDVPEGSGQFQYPYDPTTDSQTPYILYVHGWNMDDWDKDHYAETAFKRLFWKGYQGRFGVFRWPTYYGFGTYNLLNPVTDPYNYNNSEHIAWISASSLLNKLNDLNAHYPDHVYVLAHSMGNVVTGEALRQAAQQGLGQLVNAYVATQAALPAHVYDATATKPYLINYMYSAHGFPAPGTPKTPNIYGNRLANNTAVVGRRINFYNTNDYALSPDIWCFNQELKPDVLLVGYYGYAGSTTDPSPWNHFFFAALGTSVVNFDILNNPNDLYSVMAYAANSYSTALGTTPISTFKKGVNLSQIWPPDLVHPSHPFDEHFYHSAEFRGDYWQQQDYWEELLSPNGFNLKQ